MARSDLSLKITLCWTARLGSVFRHLRSGQLDVTPGRLTAPLASRPTSVLPAVWVPGLQMRRRQAARGTGLELG